MAISGLFPSFQGIGEIPPIPPYSPSGPIGAYYPGLGNRILSGRFLRGGPAGRCEGRPSRFLMGVSVGGCGGGWVGGCPARRRSCWARSCSIVRRVASSSWAAEEEGVGAVASSDPRPALAPSPCEATEVVKFGGGVSKQRLEQISKFQPRRHTPSCAGQEPTSR